MHSEQGLGKGRGRRDSSWVNQERFSEGSRTLAIFDGGKNFTFKEKETVDQSTG